MWSLKFRYARRARSVISAGTVFRGKVDSDGVLEIKGRVDGDIRHKGLLIIGRTGRCHGEVQAADMLVAGAVHGDAQVNGKVEILAGGLLAGDVRCARLQVHTGGVLRGASLMDGRQAGQIVVQPEPAEPVALPPEAAAAAVQPPAAVEPELAAAQPETAEPEPAELQAAEPEPAELQAAEPEPAEMEPAEGMAVVFHGSFIGGIHNRRSVSEPPADKPT